MLIKLYNIIKNFKIENHLATSILSTVIGIIVVTIIFVVSNLLDNKNLIAEFSVLFVIYFSISLICMLGNDQEIVAKSNFLKNKKNIIFIDEKIFKVFFGVLLSGLIFFFINKYIYYLKIVIDSNQLKVLFYSSVLFLLNKNIQSYCLASSLLLQNALIDLLRAFGYVFFLVAWLINNSLNISLIFLFGEIFIITFLPFYFFFNNFKISFIKKKLKFDFNYLIIGISQFSYQSIFKLDILILSVLGNYNLVILYTILSNVIEGLVNFFATFHPSCNNYILKKYNKILIKKKEKNNIRTILKICMILIFLIIPSYFILNILILNEFPNFNFQIMCLILVISLIVSRKMFLFFFAFSMCQKPMIQLIFSIAFVVCNLILNIILFNLIGVFGLAVATALTYVIFYKLHNFLFNRIIAQEN
jgi:hypothetical protein